MADCEKKVLTSSVDKISLTNPSMMSLSSVMAGTVYECKRTKGEKCECECG